MKPWAASRRLVWSLAVTVLSPVLSVSAQEKTAAEQEGVARLLSPTGTMVSRKGPLQPWQVVKQNEKLQPGRIYVCAGDTSVENLSGTVQLSLVEDLAERVSGTSPFPIIETAVVFQEAKKADLSFALDRGRVLLSSRKKEGAANVTVTAAGETWHLGLLEGSQVAVETFGRWACGQDFIKDPPPGHGPCQDVIFLVVKGEASLRHQGTYLALHAPPGPAYVQWEKNGPGQIRPRRLEKLPQWTKEMPEAGPAEVKKDPEAIRRLRRVAVEKGLEGAIDELLQSDKKEDRLLGVYAAAALDDLPRLAKILGQSRHPDLWDHAVLALRHWIGRGPGQDQKLYHALVASGRLTPQEAEILLHLLHSFDENEVRQPETYELLIEYLRHPKLGIRGLAHWHLVRLVPEGAGIKYHPLDSEEQREQAYQEWKKLVPSGQLPSGIKK